jgi:hypothetical protein
MKLKIDFSVNIIILINKLINLVEKITKIWKHQSVFIMKKQET